ncbi:hypothetical protein DTO013E5_798 [Penicillium roqueforti]|nr:hypothetical protein CBS147318_2250 [Penicillium roqueforti]KAI2728308.1 hypothetical protein CBS147354_2841 [Penicillium roqueforti]KAI2747508.1 hypothetical protein DTO012A1_154 [Penicillium roqueforti]KAI2750918.1 hypothetical protein DTO013F2_4169 [Penicillium roqueforti]KAI2774980.1 hypothetical protein DTO012A8_465 [Penicillium roqueforti]
MNGLTITPFIANLPKVELHVHIEGTLTPSLRWELSHRNNIPLPYATFSDLQASYAVTLNHRPELNGRQPGIPTFLEAYFAGCEVLRAETDFYDLAMAYLRRCAAMNVRYTEPFFDIQAHTRRGIPAEAVLDGYLRAQHDGAAQLGLLLISTGDSEVRVFHTHLQLGLSLSLYIYGKDMELSFNLHNTKTGVVK